MNIGTHFSGQPMYGQLIDLLSKRYSILLPLHSETSLNELVNGC